MGDYTNVFMTIYGKINDLDTVKALADQMADYVSPGWDDPRFSEYEAASYILECIESGSGITVFRSETGEDFAGISEVCRNRGLAYRVRFERAAGESASMRTWAPGFDQEKWPDVNDEFVPVISVSAVAKLMKDGAVKLAEEVDRRVTEGLVGIPKLTSAEPEVLAAIRSYIDAEGKDDDNEDGKTPNPGQNLNL